MAVSVEPLQRVWEEDSSIWIAPVPISASTSIRPRPSWAAGEVTPARSSLRRHHERDEDSSSPVTV